MGEAAALLDAGALSALDQRSVNASDGSGGGGGGGKPAAADLGGAVGDDASALLADHHGRASVDDLVRQRAELELRRQRIRNPANLTSEQLLAQEHTAMLFLFLVVVLQCGIFLAQKRWPRRFQEVTLTFMWLYPLMVVYKSHDFFAFMLLAAWAAWSAQTFVLLRAAMAKQLAPRTPERVYSWFLTTHNVCYLSGSAAFYSFLLIPGPAILVGFFSLYFAVLGRDFAEICAARISSNLGFSRYETPPPNLCALCNEELRPSLAMMTGEAGAEETATKIIKLSCGHEYHPTCIMGWCIVGKKETCPFCKEKVELTSVLPDSAWNSKRISVFWIRMLTVIRFLVVWNPIIQHLDFMLLKLFHMDPLRDARGKVVEF